MGPIKIYCLTLVVQRWIQRLCSTTKGTRERRWRDVLGRHSKPRGGWGAFYPSDSNRHSLIFPFNISTTLHYVHFVKYDDAVSFYDAVSDTIRRRGGDRGIFTEEGVDTVAYFGGNHGFRVWKSLKLKKVYFPRTRTSWDKYMFNRIVFVKI